MGESNAEPSEDIRKRVNAARKIQSERFKIIKIHCNTQMTSRYIKRHCKIDDASCDLLESAC
jgi:magnesium chelatase family protein